MSKELQKWADSIDIGKDGKKDSAEYDYLKNKLSKDVERLWNLKLDGKISEQEYSKYANKLKQILETNSKGKKELEHNYEEESKKIIIEAKSKTKSFYEDIKGTDRIKRKISEMSVRNEIEGAKKNGKDMILGFDSVRLNYAIEVKDFELQLKQTDLTNINAKALSEYFIYLIDKGKFSPETLGKMMGKEKILHLCELWGSFDTKNPDLNSTIARKALKDSGGRYLKTVETVLGNHLQKSKDIFGTNVFHRLYNATKGEIPAYRLIMAMEESMKGSGTLDIQKTVKIISASGIGKNIKPSEIIKAYEGTTADILKGEQINKFIAYKQSMGFSGDEYVKYSEVIKKIDPKFSSDKLDAKTRAFLTKVEVAALNPKNKKDIGSIKSAISGLKNAGANANVLKYFELYLGVAERSKNYSDSDKASKMGNDRARTQSEQFHRGEKVEKIIKVTDSFISLNEQAEDLNDDKNTISALNKIRGFENFKDFTSLIDNGELLDKAISELSKKKDKDSINALSKLKKLRKSNTKDQILNIASREAKTEKEIEAAIKKGDIKLPILGGSLDDSANAASSKIDGKSHKIAKTDTDAENAYNSENAKSAPLAKEFSSSNYVSVPSNFSSPIERTQFFNSIFSAIDTTRSMTIKLPGGMTFTLEKGNGSESYSVAYGGNKGIKHEGLSRKEVKNSLSFAEYTNSIGLGFLIPNSREIINKINASSDGEKIFDRDGLDRKEKMLFLSKIGPMLIPGYINTLSMEANEEQFRHVSITGKDIAKKSPKLQNIIGRFSSVEELAKTLYPANGGKDFNSLAFLQSFGKQDRTV